jgi:hypothetical protein
MTAAYATAWLGKAGEERAYHPTLAAAEAHEAELRRAGVVLVAAYWCGEGVA